MPPISRKTKIQNTLLMQKGDALCAAFFYVYSFYASSFSVVSVAAISLAASATGVQAFAVFLALMA